MVLSSATSLCSTGYPHQNQQFSPIRICVLPHRLVPTGRLLASSQAKAGRSPVPSVDDKRKSGKAPRDQRGQDQGRTTPQGSRSGAPVEPGQVLELECARLAVEGKGVCLLPPTGYVVLVERTLPGESVRAEVVAVKRGYAEARKLASLAPHRHAVPPPCPHFGPCGGCTLQSLDYSAQLREKRNQVEQTLRRVGRLGPALDQLAAATAGAAEPLAGEPASEGVADSGQEAGLSSADDNSGTAVVGCSEPFGYRNKMVFHFSSRCWVPPEQVVDRPALGFLRPGTVDVVLPVTQHGCLLQGTEANALLRRVDQLVSEHGLLPYNHRSGQGFLKQLVIRRGAGGAADQPAVAAGSLEESAAERDEIMVVFGVTRRSGVPQLKPVADALAREFPNLASIVAQQVPAPLPPPGRIAAARNQRAGGARDRGRSRDSRSAQPQGRQTSRASAGSSPDDGASASTSGGDDSGDSLTGFAAGSDGAATEATVLYGKPYIHDRLRGLTFRISPGSFFQTNSRQAEVLYGIVRQAAGLRPGAVDAVLDLYCGTGTIGLSLAADCRAVVGVEVVESAVSDAHVNASLNGIDNATFICADVDQLPGLALTPDVVVVDPARAGMSAAAAAYLARCGARRVVYVSCNVATQARDLDRLCNGAEAAFRLVSVKMVDMFPHTDHVETVAVLDRLQ